MDKVIKIVGVS